MVLSPYFRETGVYTADPVIQAITMRLQPVCNNFKRQLSMTIILIRKTISQIVDLYGRLTIIFIPDNKQHPYLKACNFTRK
jgi:hypothetical protein